MKKWLVLLLIPFLFSGCTLAEFFCIRNYTNKPILIMFPRHVFHNGYEILIKHRLIDETEIKSDLFLKGFITHKTDIKNNKITFIIPEKSTVYLERFKKSFKHITIKPAAANKDYIVKNKKQIYKPNMMSAVYCTDIEEVKN